MQAVVQMTGAPNANAPEQWPANAAPKAHRRVLSDAKTSAASFQAKQPNAGSIAAQMSASHSLQEAATKLEALSAGPDMQQASSQQEAQALSPNEHPSASHSLQQAAKKLHPTLSHPHAMPQDAMPQEATLPQGGKGPSSEQQQSASHLLQAASAARALHPDDAQGKQAASAHTELTAFTEQASASHRLQLASAAKALQPGTSQAHPLPAQASAQNIDMVVLDVPLSASHDLQQAAAAVAVAPPSDADQAAEASQDMMPVPDQTVPVSQEATAAVAVAPQPDAVQHDPDQQPLTPGMHADDSGKRGHSSPEPHSPTSAHLEDRSSQDQQPPLEPGSLPLKPFQPSSTLVSAADLEQEAEAMAGLVQEPAAHPALVPLGPELGANAADLAAAHLIAEPLTQEPSTQHTAGIDDAPADLMAETGESVLDCCLYGMSVARRSAFSFPSKIGCLLTCIRCLGDHLESVALANGQETQDPISPSSTQIPCCIKKQPLTGAVVLVSLTQLLYTLFLLNHSATACRALHTRAGTKWHCTGHASNAQWAQMAIPSSCKPRTTRKALQCPAANGLSGLGHL